jgi:hypothetical protein
LHGSILLVPTCMLRIKQIFGATVLDCMDPLLHMKQMIASRVASSRINS